MKYEPTSVLISGTPQRHKRMIIQFVQYLTNKVKPYARFVGDFVVCGFSIPLEDVDNFDRVFFT
jgi:hypothetical protein